MKKENAKKVGKVLLRIDNRTQVYVNHDITPDEVEALKEKYRNLNKIEPIKKYK